MNNKLFKEIVSASIANLHNFINKHPSNPAKQDILQGIQKLQNLL